MSENKKYYVRLPFAGVVAVTVEAEDEESAVQQALQLESKHTEFFQHKTALSVELESWDAYEKLCEGNYWYGEIYEAEVIELEDED